MNLEPRKDCVLLAPHPDDMRGAALDSKIIVPGQYAEPSRLSKVAAVGAKVYDIKVGDIVFSSRYPRSAWEIEHEGEKFVSVKAEEILAKLEVRNGKVRRNGSFTQRKKVTQNRFAR